MYQKWGVIWNADGAEVGRVGGGVFVCMQDKGSIHMDMRPRDIRVCAKNNDWRMHNKSHNSTYFPYSLYLTDLLSASYTFCFATSFLTFLFFRLTVLPIIRQWSVTQLTGSNTRDVLLRSELTRSNRVFRDLPTLARLPYLWSVFQFRKDCFLTNFLCKTY